MSGDVTPPPGRPRERHVPRVHAVCHGFCESVLACGVMKNITVSVPDEVYRQARIRSAERGQSVSALVAQHLRSLSDHDAEFARLEALQRRVQSQIKRFRGSDRLDRAELHDRAVH